MDLGDTRRCLKDGFHLGVAKKRGKTGVVHPAEEDSRVMPPQTSQAVRVEIGWYDDLMSL